MDLLEQIKKIFKFNKLIGCIKEVDKDKERIRVWLTFPNDSYYRGFSDNNQASLHGGITRKLFDVMTVATAFILGGYQGPTCQGSWKLRQPIPLEQKLCLEGTVEKVKLGFIWINLKIFKGEIVYAEAREALKILLK